MMKKVAITAAITIALAGYGTLKSAISKNYEPIDGDKITLTLTKDSEAAIHKN
jgi:(p)ppGpp synthase/HD superfamily hydrolase